MELLLSLGEKMHFEMSSHASSRDKAGAPKKHDHCHCCDCIVSFLSWSKAHAATIDLGTFLYTLTCHGASSYQGCSQLRACKRMRSVHATEGVRNELGRSLLCWSNS
uniref:Uncharacterized protein n=1 Tax=Rhipicephalus zambeziensis TaxID=60191 RepID=A0A224YGI2_9ACAR